ncbi:hypothetical protein [Mucilaginibacter aquatilis]|uniref:Uncharacterized protein n=1 Tax=Mucilaginibacter aquatilis TaxID=1517760 RepID=A0A6I4I8H4_9SPHI|nr:hypothetical protein [Mucilaginibacter aquatilis]MVN91510.1 hypothetical protein [Mucilaginibacter aquatilis]
MKNLIVLAVAAMLCAACKDNHDGKYVTKVSSQYSIAEDTIILNGDLIIKRIGYHKIINDSVLPKHFSIKSWHVGDFEAPVIQFGSRQITINGTIYKKIEP